jgi:hypothetical protein
MELYLKNQPFSKEKGTANIRMRAVPDIIEPGG